MASQEEKTRYDLYSSAVGSCIIKWNEVEVFLLNIFQKLLNSDEFGTYAVWYSFNSIRPRIELMRKLGKKRLQIEDYESLKALLIVVQKESGQRNFIAHSLSIDDETGEVNKVIMSAHPIARSLGIAKKDSEIDATEINEIYEDFQHLKILINTIYFGIYHNGQKPSLHLIKTRRSTKK